MNAHTHTLTSDYTREAPLSPPAFLGSTVSVTPCGTSDTRSTAASLHSSSWLSSAHSASTVKRSTKNETACAKVRV